MFRSFFKYTLTIVVSHVPKRGFKCSIFASEISATTRLEPGSKTGAVRIRRRMTKVTCLLQPFIHMKSRAFRQLCFFIPAIGRRIVVTSVTHNKSSHSLANIAAFTASESPKGSDISDLHLSLIRRPYTALPALVCLTRMPSSNNRFLSVC